MAVVVAAGVGDGRVVAIGVVATFCGGGAQGGMTEEAAWGVGDCPNIPVPPECV